jgi:enamine deaminase RidA (YjgF/YER057c/UK114 family)
MMNVEHLNPEGLVKNPAFSQAVAVTGAHKVIYVGGQNAVDATTRQIVGQADLRAQAEQVFRNLRTALEAGGAGLEHIVKWNVYLVQGQDARAAFEVSQREWGDRPDPPALSVMFVAGLANPGFLLEIDAIAVVPAPAVRPTVSVAAIGP